MAIELILTRPDYTEPLPLDRAVPRITARRRQLFNPVLFAILPAG